MKGIIFNLLEDYICTVCGDEVFERILEQCDFATRDPFVGPGTYPDEELYRMLDAAVETLGVSRAEALRAFGRYCIPRFAQKYPVFFRGHRHPKAFLLTMGSVHHIELVKLYVEARPPRLLMSTPSPEVLVLRYESTRQLSPLVAGLLEGTADHFGVGVKFEEVKCVHRGDATCEYHVTFDKVESAA